MDWVLDSSIALALALPDETSEHADNFFGRIASGSVLWVPALWWYEMANALIGAQRRKRLTETDRMRLIELYRMSLFKRILSLTQMPCTVFIP